MINLFIFFCMCFLCLIALNIVIACFDVWVSYSILVALLLFCAKCEFVKRIRNKQENIKMTELRGKELKKKLNILLY